VAAWFGIAEARGKTLIARETTPITTQQRVITVGYRSLVGMARLVGPTESITNVLLCGLSLSLG
jgi:hypothetical protein